MRSGHSIATIAAVVTTLLTLGVVVFSHGKAQARLEVLSDEMTTVRVAVREIEKHVAQAQAHDEVFGDRLEQLDGRMDQMTQEIRANGSRHR